jgi:hypothetical protein
VHSAGNCLFGYFRAQKIPQSPSATLKSKQRENMLTYILGPLLSIFPKRWREALPFSGHVRWARATSISGIAESVAALVVLSHWYLYAMNT